MGKPQILPRPIAEPDAANTNAVLELNLPLAAITITPYRLSTCATRSITIGRLSSDKPAIFILVLSKR